MPDPKDLEAVAHLVGATNAQLKQLDDQIVSKSSNLQTSNENWDPKNVISSAARDLHMPIQPVSQNTSVPVQAIEPVASVAPLPVQVQPQPQPLPVMSPDAVGILLRIEQKLDLYMDKVNRLEKIGDAVNKSIERGLKSKLKQVTIKLDDSVNNK
jgi:hypothetical protein